jgi:ech hydrogenase subunit B
MTDYLLNIDMHFAYIILLTIFVGPIVGGLITGIDRKLTARLQGRFGPPILQPFYDFFKLIGKERFTVNATQMIYVIGTLFFAVTALIMFTTGMDMLMMVFVLAFSNISLIMGAMSVRSPFSKIGAQREIIQMMAYEPVILLMVVGIYKITGSFMISVPFSTYGRPLIADLPLLFFAFSYILTIKLRKSPFDYSTSHHGHQELIKGLTMEFSGLQLAMIELTHWYEVVLLMGLVVMFWAQPIWAGILLAIGIYIIEIIIDNICARTTWKWMLKMTGIVGLGTALTNIIWLYLAK